MGERYPWALSSTINYPLGSVALKHHDLDQSLARLNAPALESRGSPSSSTRQLKVHRSSSHYFGVGPQTERDLSGHLHTKLESTAPPVHQSVLLKSNSDLGLHDHSPAWSSRTTFSSGPGWDVTAGEAGRTLQRWSSAASLTASYQPHAKHPGGTGTLRQAGPLMLSSRTAVEEGPHTQRTISLECPLYSSTDTLLSPSKYQPRWRADDQVYRHLKGASSTSLQLQHTAYRSVLDRPFSRHLDERRAEVRAPRTTPLPPCRCRSLSPVWLSPVHPYRLSAVPLLHPRPALYCSLL